MNYNLLWVDDEVELLKAHIIFLEKKGYEVTTVSNGSDAIDMCRNKSFDLVLLDVMMPGKSGYDVCREIRAAGSRVAVLMLSAKGEEIDKVIGLELGADDYVTKPFGVRELLARVAAAIRRAEGPSGAARAEAASESDFPFCGVRASVKRYVLEGPGGSVAVTELEMKLMKTLSVHKGEVMTRDTLLNLVWGTNYYGTTRTLDQHLVNLRRKLERIGGDTSHIRTVHGVGYSFIP